MLILYIVTKAKYTTIYSINNLIKIKFYSEKGGKMIVENKIILVGLCEILIKDKSNEKILYMSEGFPAQNIQTYNYNSKTNVKVLDINYKKNLEITFNNEK
jgi:hypothetical protein